MFSSCGQLGCVVGEGGVSGIGGNLSIDWSQARMKVSILTDWQGNCGQLWTISSIVSHSLHTGNWSLVTPQITLHHGHVKNLTHKWLITAKSYKALVIQLSLYLKLKNPEQKPFRNIKYMDWTSCNLVSNCFIN